MWVCGCLWMLTYVCVCLTKGLCLQLPINSNNGQIFMAKHGINRSVSFFRDSTQWLLRTILFTLFTSARRRTRAAKES